MVTMVANNNTFKGLLQWREHFRNARTLVPGKHAKNDSFSKFDMETKDFNTPDILCSLQYL